METEASTKKKTWLLLALLIIMTISMCKQAQATVPEHTSSTIYFRIPIFLRSLIIKTTDSFANNEIIVIGQMRVNNTYNDSEAFMQLQLPANFTLMDNDTLKKLSPYVPNGGEWEAIWVVRAPNTTGNYSINVTTFSDTATKNITISEARMGESDLQDWSVGVMLVFLSTAVILIYLGSKLEEEHGAIKIFLYSFSLLVLLLGVNTTRIMVEVSNGTKSLSDVGSAINTLYIIYIPLLMFLVGYVFIYFLTIIVHSMRFKNGKNE